MLHTECMVIVSRKMRQNHQEQQHLSKNTLELKISINCSSKFYEFWKRQNKRRQTSWYPTKLQMNQKLSRLSKRRISKQQTLSDVTGWTWWCLLGKHLLMMMQVKCGVFANCYYGNLWLARLLIMKNWWRSSDLKHLDNKNSVFNHCYTEHIWNRNYHRGKHHILIISRS